MVGLTPLEDLIMDLWDRGHSFQAIARQIAVTPKYAQKIVSTFTAAHEERDNRRDMLAGSQRLAAAIDGARRSTFLHQPTKGEPNG